MLIFLKNLRKKKKKILSCSMIIVSIMIIVFAIRLHKSVALLARAIPLVLKIHKKPSLGRVG